MFKFATRVSKFKHITMNSR